MQISLPLRRDGTDGQAVVFWSLQPTGANRGDVTTNDLRPFNGSIVFLSKQSDAFINLTVMADNIPEVNETLLLTLDRWVEVIVVYISFLLFIIEGPWTHTTSFI